MGTNSIRGNITPDNVITLINLTLSAGLNKNIIIIVVEGIKDIDFFNGKIADNVTLEESYSGYSGVEHIVSTIQDVRVIGVRDRDYIEDVEVNAYQEQQIFCYDYNCLEMMLIASDEMFVSFVSPYYKGQIEALQLRDILLKSLIWLSCFRKLNFQYEWGIRFEGLKIANFFESTSHTINKAKLLENLKNINPTRLQTLEEKIPLVDQYVECNQDVDVFYATQGHDFVTCFQCVHANSIVKKCCSADNLHKSLLAAYRMSDFEKTTLCTNMRTYEERYSCTILKTSVITPIV